MSPSPMLDFDRPPQDVARDLLGMTLTALTDDGSVTVRITETEAYEGGLDPASHAYRGRTPRNEVMFGPGGRLYVYRSHGLHWCCNVVTGAVGNATAVLLRAGDVVEGHPLARARRGPHRADHELARGPGNLAQALGLTGADNGVVIGEDRLVLGGRSAPAGTVAAGPRVGVSVAADLPWRYWVSGDRSVSAYRRSPRAPDPRA